MQCAVPSCPGWEKQLVPFPQNLVLQSRWKRAIEAGTGLRIPMYHCGALCSWHFGDDQTRNPREYWEPYRFLHRKGKPVEVGSCRFCLRFDDRQNMVSDKEILNNPSLVRLVRYALRIKLTEDDILKDVCKECESKVEVVDKWLKSSKKTEMEYKALEGATKKIVFKKVGAKVIDEDKTPHAAEKANALSMEVEIMDPKLEDHEEDSEHDQPNDQMESIVEDDHVNTDHDYVVEALNDSSENAQVVVSEEIISGRPLVPVVKKYNFPPNTHSKRGPQRRPKPKDTGEQIKYREYLSKKCSICDTVLDSPEDLVAHLTQNHSNGSPYKCTECGKSFKLITSYNRHLGFHDETNRPLKCCYCPMGFKYNHSLLNHENRHHGANHQIPQKKKPSEKTFQCMKCDKAYRTNYDLLDHDRYIHQQLPGTTCKLCGKHFRNRASLRKHHLVHTGDRPYDCPHCDSVFRNTTSLVRHVAHNHKDIAPVDPKDIIEESDPSFKCAICEQQFHTQSELVQHINVTHIGI
ncbi:zinc finger protein 808 [Aedes aegypti]|uniref:C2H2-type domain-containing protein n=1 Tax=Aedes aegypti TaxID=7159 RepID=A0A1S4FZB7_AEDAE|nr:zinc finger protein 808 [Aedes aegypti]